MSRRSFARIATAFAVSALLITLATAAAGPQQKPTARTPWAEKDKQGPARDSADVNRDAPIDIVVRPRDEVTEQIEKSLKSYDLKPHPWPSVPDDPPPHEGAMIDLPLVVEPPDLVIIEVLEALPGRPISGERLVRPDGNINLGFYGEIHVRGLTLAQIKVAMIKHLRRFIDDDTLGLRVDPNADDQGAVPEPPVAGNPFEPDPVAKKGEPAPAPVVQPAEARPRFVAPEESDRVFVDITAYNSTYYYVLGDVLVPGRLPCSGKETVLDAVQYAGGLLPTAEPKDIRLVRPGRNGKPSRVYKVDLEAIQDRGELRSNYQIFPGDRLIVGQNEVVKRTVEIDRLHSPIQLIVTSIQQNVNLVKSLGGLTAEQGDELLKDLVDFWAKEVSRKGDLKFDEQTLRAILLRRLNKAPAAPGPGPK